MSRFLLSLALLVAAVPLQAQTLDADAEPRQGTIQAASTAEALDLLLSTPDEHPEPDCAGFIDASSPDATVMWSGGGPLRFWVRTSADATLTIIGPDGEMVCDDDTDGVQPAVLYEQPASGRYAVWVGAFGWDQSDDTAATLHAGPPPPAPSLGSAASAPMLSFSGADDVDLDVTPGGLHPAASLGMPEFCVGFYDAEPTARVSGPTPYSLVASSDADLTLAVRTRGGGWLCEDDIAEYNTDAAVEIEVEGEQTVWVGTFRGYARDDVPTATLTATAEPVLMGDIVMPVEPSFRRRFSEADYSVLDLDTRGTELTLAAGTDSLAAAIDIGETVPNPVSGDLCRGHIPFGRSLTITAEGDGPFSLHATGDDDLVLVARDSEGRWFCSDDGLGRDPTIEVETNEVAVWIGTFTSLESSAATLSVMRGALDDVLPEDDIEYDIDFYDDGPLAYSEGEYDGDELGGEAQTMLALEDGSVEAEVFAGGDLFMPVEGDACTGYVSSAPTASAESDAGTVVVSATALDDLTLLVRAPDGTWWCSDDAEGRDPQVVMSNAGDGAYSIWVGTFDALDAPVEAIVTVSEGPSPPEEALERPAPPPPPPPIRD